jgi:hypothetical protein
MQFDQSTAECKVFAYREGVLSSFAHDLRITVTSFVIRGDLDMKSIRAKFDAGSLHVDCVMDHGKERYDILTEENKKEIDGYIFKDILDSEFYEEITFESTSITKEGKHYLVKGILSLCGTEKEIGVKIGNGDGRQVAEATIHQPDFGIKPFSAMMGTIRVKPDVLVRVSVPLRIPQKFMQEEKST